MSREPWIHTLGSMKRADDPGMEYIRFKSEDVPRVRELLKNYVGISYNEEQRRELWDFVRTFSEGGDINWYIREANRLVAKYDGLPF